MIDLKNTIYWKAFSDSWQVMKSFYPTEKPQNEDLYYTSLISMVETVANKYKGTEAERFIKTQLLSVTEELERLERQL